jgi:hypothetical protein
MLRAEKIGLGESSALSEQLTGRTRMTNGSKLSGPITSHGTHF